MLYEKDFARFRERIDKLQVFNRRVHNRAERREKFQNFSDNCTIHGFSYIFYRNVHQYERYFWACCVVISIVATCYTCIKLSNKYNDNFIVTVVEESQYPVFRVQFPAIAICPLNHVNWSRLKLARTKFLPEDASNATLRVFTKLVKYLNSFEFRTFNNLAGIEHEPLNLLDSFSLTNLAKYLAFRCDELFDGTCVWAEKPFDCCKMLVQESTGLGMCWVFNSIISEESKQKSLNDNFYPYHNSKNGEGSGLFFKTKYNASNIVPGTDEMSGIELIIKKPDQWTDRKTFRLRLKTYNGVIIRPESTKASTYLKSFPPSERNCVFESEKENFNHIPGLTYRQWNCKSQCHHQYLIAHCNCTLPLFFQNIGVEVRECTASDLVCIYNHRDVFEYDRRANEETLVRQLGRGMLCNCRSSCDAVNYQISLNAIPTYNESDINNTTLVDIYYQSEVILKYLSILEFTTLELVSYFGGIVTLFLGASILSGIEAVYFLFMELSSYLQERSERGRISVNPSPDKSVINKSNEI